MIRKKAQGEIITTVLIILLVLAAIVIVWQVVNSTVSRSGSQAQSAANCVGVQMNIDGTITNNSAATTLTFRIKRGSDTVGVDGIKVFITNSSGTVQSVDITTVPSQYASTLITTGTFGTAFTRGSNSVSIAPKIGTTQCDPVDTQSFVV